MRTSEEAAAFLSATLKLGAKGEFMRAVELVRLEAFIAGMTEAAEIAQLASPSTIISRKVGSAILKHRDELTSLPEAK